jgi:nicotinamide-nucleotide amidase
MREMWEGTLLAALRGMGAGTRVILRRNIKCFGAGESQLESMLPDIIRRGRVPQVGINASRATIILRIVAEGESEAACRAQIEATVAEIRQCLGTLVYGEGDDELQDVAIDLLRQRACTLASAEIVTGGLAAQWLAKASGNAGPYRGGLVAADDAAMAGLLPTALPYSPEAVETYVRALAIACRERLHTDFGLAIGPMPESSAAGHVYFALSSATGVRMFRVSSGIHPDILLDYLAKHAINLLRLELLA